MENESKIVETVAKLETKVEQHDKEIDNLKDTQKMIYEMNSNIKSLVEKMGDTNNKITGIECQIKDIRTDMEEVKNKDDKEDAKKYNGLKKQIITAVVTAIIAIVLAKIGLI